MGEGAEKILAERHAYRDCWEQVRYVEQDDSDRGCRKVNSKRFNYLLVMQGVSRAPTIILAPRPGQVSLTFSPTWPKVRVKVYSERSLEVLEF